MNRMKGAHALERLSQNDTVIHRIHPMAKLVTTTIYIFVVVSFGRYEILGLLPYLFYPAVVTALSETPYRPLLLRMLVALPFCLFAGIANCFFDREIAFSVFSYGCISLVSILIKMFLCVMAALLLLAVTRMDQLSRCLICLHVPAFFVMLLAMIYRYIYTMIDTASSVTCAYHLRNPMQNGIAMKDMGAVLGQMLVRGMDKGERVYTSMQVRGYDGTYAYAKNGNMESKDIIYMVLFVCAVILLRIFPMGGF